MVMMLWTAALKAALVGGVPTAQQHGLLYQLTLTLTPNPNPDPNPDPDPNTDPNPDPNT